MENTLNRQPEPQDIVAQLIPWPETMSGVDAKRWQKTGKNFLRVFSTQPPPKKNAAGTIGPSEI